MAIWGRLMHTINAARRAYMTYGASSASSAVDPLKWDVTASRMARYAIYESYYSNTAYFDKTTLTAMQQLKPKVYKHIRGVYNPTNRFVTLYQSKIYGGALDLEGIIDGAIPIEQADDALREAIIQIWRWSNWQQNKSVYVQTGAKFGDVLLKVVDDVFRQRVRLEVIDPRKIAVLETDDVGDVVYVYIEYERIDEQTGKTYTYGEEITPEYFATFKGTEPFAYYQDATGNPVSEWANEYGFVPMTLCQHSPTGLTWGQNGFHASLDKINEVNDQASILNDQVRKVVNPIWAVAGAQKANLELDIERETIPTVHLPAGATISPLTNAIDIGSASNNIKDLLAELERDLPELALYRLREQSAVTAPGVKAAYSDAIGRIQEARGQYDGALVKAQQMAVAIGGYRGYDGFGSYNIDSYLNGDLEHFVGNRPVVPDELSQLEKITVLQTLGGTKKLVLKQLGYSDDVIDEIMAADEERARSEVRSMTEGIFGSTPDEEDEDIPDEEDEAETLSNE